MIYNDNIPTEYGNFPDVTSGASPTMCKPKPNSLDYSRGYVTRFFAKKLNDDVIVEIDGKAPSFIKDTLTVIDDRNPEKDSEHLQLSNFSLLEDRETHNMEIYLTRLGEHGGGNDIWTADAYKYTLIF